MTFNVASFNAGMARYFAPRLSKMLYEVSPFLAMMPKEEKAAGGAQGIAIPIQWSNSGGGSRSFARAQQNRRAPNVDAFIIGAGGLKEDYASAWITGQAQMQAEIGNAQSVFKDLIRDLDLGYNTVQRSICTALFRGGSGSLGRRAGALAGETVTLTNVSDARNYEIGMVVQVAGGDGTGALRDGGRTATLAAVDTDNGTITSEVGGFTGIAGFAANDYVYRDGDYNGDGVLGKVLGLEAWIPATAPATVAAGGTLFAGIDRGLHPTRLAGHRFNGAGMPIEDALQQGLARVAADGTRKGPETVIVSHETFSNLVVSIGSRDMRDRSVKRTAADIGFDGVSISYANGSAQVFADRDCPQDVAWGLTMESWKLYSLGRVPHIAMDDGLKVARVSNADAIEYRVRYFAEAGCDNPGANVRIALA